MRTIVYVCLIISLIACDSNPPDSFKMEGYVEGARDSESIFLSYYSLINGEWFEIEDTTKIVNGKFTFEGRIEELTAAELMFSEPEHVVISVRIYMEPTTMKLRINKDQPYAYELLGTKVEKENIELRKELEADEKIFHEYSLHIDNLYTQVALNEDDQPVKDSLINEFYQSLDSVKDRLGRMKEIKLNFALKHRSYRIVPDLLFYFPAPIDSVKSIYNSLPEPSKTGLMGQLVSKKIAFEENKKNSLVGNIAPDFTRIDASGKTIRLSDYKNRNYVLFAFWASWCAPCIEVLVGENPKVKNLYDKYSQKGLELIGISLDEDNDRWLNVINNYQLNQWPQILAFQHENKSAFNYDDISALYDVEVAPYYILIDKQGKIVARWDTLDEEQLIEIDNQIR